MIDELTDLQRLTLLAEALAAMYPARIVTRDLTTYEQRNEDELKAGIYTVLNAGVEGYRNYNGREMADGNHKISVFFQTLVGENATGVAVEDTELAAVAEMKAFLRAAAPALPAELCCLACTGYLVSGQLDKPFASVRFDLECRDNE